MGTLLGIALLVWVFVRLAQEQKIEALRETFGAALQSPLWLALAVAVFAGSLACGAARWMALLRALSIPMKPARAIQLYIVGHFFNAVVPGATGGDVVKAAYAAADHAEQRPEAVASIVTGTPTLSCAPRSCPFIQTRQRSPMASRVRRHSVSPGAGAGGCRDK